MVRKYTRFFRISLKKLIKQKNITPHSIAMGFAVGVFVAFTPLVGFQILLSLAICILLKYNKLAGFIGVFISNPFTFFPIYFFNYYIGLILFGRFFENAMNLKNLENSIEKITSLSKLLELGYGTIAVFFIGSFLVGLVAGIISYFIVKELIKYYRKKKRLKN